MPGEWGKLLGLDRIPEVRTLREKLQILIALIGTDYQSSGWLLAATLFADYEKTYFARVKY